MEHNKVLKGLYPITPSLYKSDIDYLSQVKCLGIRSKCVSVFLNFYLSGVKDFY